MTPKTRGCSDNIVFTTSACLAPCLAPCLAWCPAPAFLQGKQQGKILFAIAPMVPRCASRFEWRAALPYGLGLSVFTNIKRPTDATRPSKCCPNGNGQMLVGLY